MVAALRLAVFDCDGTLVDSQHSICAAMRAAFAVHGWAEPEADAVRRLVGLPLLQAIRILVPDAAEGACERVRESYSVAYHALRAEGRLDDPLFPGAREAIDAIDKAGWILGLATGKSHRGLVATLERHEIIGRFATLQTADRALGKPHPDMLLKAMAESGVEPKATAMIGDTTFDMEMAKSAGTVAIGVAWGYHDPEELRAAGADRVVADFASLPGVLAELMEDMP